MMLDFASWTAAAVRILAGSALIFLLALAVRQLGRSAAIQRAIWQAALTISSLFMMSEMSGTDMTALLKRAEDRFQKAPEVRLEVREPSTSVAPIGIQPHRAEQNIVTSPPQAFLWPAIAWAIGTSLLLCLRLFQTAICRVARKRSRFIYDGLLPQKIVNIARLLRFGKEVRIYKSDIYRTPVAFGSWAPSLGLPERFEEEFSQEEQEAILAHELTHLANLDPLWRGVADYLCALCWWNPFVWCLRRQFLHACEFAADEESARISNGEVLARALVSVANKLLPRWRGNWVGMAGAYRSNLGRRVNRLLNHKRSTRRSRSDAERVIHLAVTFLLLISASLGLNILETSVNGLTLTGGISPLRLALTTILVTAQPSPGNVVAKIKDTPPFTPKEEALPDAPALPAAVELTEPALILVETKEENPRKTLVAAAEPSPAAIPENADEPKLESEVKEKILIEAKWIETSVSVDLFRELGLDNLAAEAEHGTQAGANLITIEPGAGWKTNAYPGGKLSGPLRAVLTKEHYDKMLTLVTNRPGLDLVSSPRLTMLSGREGLISIVEIQTIVTGIDTNSTAANNGNGLETQSMEFGPSLRVFPTLTDNRTIALRAEGTVRDFMGYDDPGKNAKAVVWDNGKKVRTKLPLPRILERRYSTDVTLRSGETLLLCGLTIPQKRRTKEKVVVLGDIPLLGRLFQSESEETYHKQLILLIHAESLPQ